MDVSNMSAATWAWFGPLMVWSLVWKGWALWKAAKNDSKGWFIALLILNTVGILEIIYIFLVAKSSKTKAK